MSRSCIVSAAIAVVFVLPVPAVAQDADLERLATRAAKGEKSETLRQDLLALGRKYPGTPAAVKVAGLLHDLPSPLDNLDKKAIPEVERFDWHPKETVAVLGEHRGRQAGPVTSVVFSRNGKFAVSGSSNGYVRIWDAATMRLSHTFGHYQGAYSLTVSKDSNLLLVGGGDGQVRQWDMSGDAPKEKDKELSPLKVCSTPLLGLAIAPNGKTFACGGSDSRVYLWDLTASPPKEESGGGGHAGAVHAVVYSPSGKTVASAGADKFIKLWTLTEQNRLKERISTETPSPVHSLAYHPKDGEKLVSGHADGTIQVWEVGTKLTPKAALKTKNGAVHALTFSATGNTLAAAFSDGTARTWAWGGKLADKASLEGHKGAVTAVAFAPNGTTIATGSADWTVRIWPVTGVKPRDKTVIKGHLSHVYTTAFHPDGASLASGSLDQSVRFWELAGADPKERTSKLKEEGHIYTLAYSPDGKVLAAGGNNAMFRTCDTTTGGYLFGFKGHTGAISRLAWSPDGKTIASCGQDKSLRLWNGITGMGTNAITTFETFVNSVAFSPNGKQLLCISGYYLYDKIGQIVVKNGETYYLDSTVRVHDASDLKEITRWKFDTKLMGVIAYTPDSRSFLVGGSDGLLRQWDAVKLPREPEIYYKYPPFGSPSAVTCSPDGHWLASYHPSNGIQLFDLATRKPVRVIPTSETFGSLAFAPDSRHLAIGLATGVVLVLRLEAAK